MISLTRTSFTTAAIAAIAVVATAGASWARPDARTMTCHQTQELIERQGAAVITTGQYTYERFIGLGGFCYHPQVPRLTYIRTKDTDQCPVYYCDRPLWPDDD